jgi:hypothetical protein
MFRYRVVLLLAAATLMASACADREAPSGPTPLSESVLTTLYGVLEMSDEPTPRIGLRESGRFVVLLCSQAPVLEARVGEPVMVSGRFNSQGEFQVESVQDANGLPVL